MEDVILRVVAAELGFVLTGDRLVADADQTEGQRTVRDEAQTLAAPASAAELLKLVDRVIRFARAGIEGAR